MRHVRIARPVSDLARAREMYRRGLGLRVLGSFQDHEGFDGVLPAFAAGVRRARTFEDPDGYRIMLQNAAWHNV